MISTHKDAQPQFPIKEKDDFWQEEMCHILEKPLASPSAIVSVERC